MTRSPLTLGFDSLSRQYITPSKATAYCVRPRKLKGLGFLANLGATGKMQRIVSEVPMRKALSSRRTVAALRIRFFVLNRVRLPLPMGIQSAFASPRWDSLFETVALGRHVAPKPRAGPPRESGGKPAIREQSGRGSAEKAIAVTLSTAKRFSTKGIISPKIDTAHQI